MRVMLVTRRLNISRGGSNASLHLLASMLSERGHEVSVVTVSPTENELPQAPSYEVVIPDEREIQTRIEIVQRTYTVLRNYENETDLFHIFRPVMLPGAGFYRYRGGTTPVVGRLNAYTMFCTNLDRMDSTCYENCSVRAKFDHSNRSLPKRVAKLPLYVSRTHLEPKIVNHINRFFAISPAVRDVYETIGLNTEKATIVPNFYDPDFGYSEASARGDDEMFGLLFVGRLKRLKGIDILLDALTQLDPSVTLDIVGDGIMKDDLKTQVQANDLGDRVTFHGWCDRSDLPQFYTNADLFVHPARLPEPFGRTLLETMQCGTPGLVSDVGGPPWIIGDAGTTFTPENASDLTRMINRLRCNPESLAQMRAACESRLERFEPDRIVDTVEAEYETVLEES